MKKIYTYFIVSIFLLGINSCCTKEYCFPIQNAPNINLKFSNFDNLDLEEVSYYKIDATNFSIIDSAENREQNNLPVALIGDFQSYFNTLEFVLDLKNNFFIIQTASSNDTIYNLDFTTSTYKKKCHTCFLANGKETFTEVQNFSFYHKGTQYFDSDTITIIK